MFEKYGLIEREISEYQVDKTHVWYGDEEDVAKYGKLKCSCVNL